MLKSFNRLSINPDYSPQIIEVWELGSASFSKEFLATGMEPRHFEEGRLNQSCDGDGDGDRCYVLSLEQPH